MKPYLPINPQCPRIAHETGVVLGCQVDHDRHPDFPHANVEGVTWGDDDDRAFTEEPHHRAGHTRSWPAQGVPGAPNGGGSELPDRQPPHRADGETAP